jgi:nucleoid-associated protein Lsr2
MTTKALIFDDLDGSELATTMVFAIDGQAWEVDLNAEHRAEFDAFMTRYIKAGRRVEQSPDRRTEPRKKQGKHSQTQTESAAIRRWAPANGHVVGPKGRIPSSVVDAYRQAHNGQAGAVGR